MLSTDEFIRKSQPTGRRPQTGATARSSSRMTADDRFRAFIDYRSQLPAPRRWGGEQEDYASGVSWRPFQPTLRDQQPDVALPIVRKEWNNSLQNKPSAANPFGESLGKTDPREDVAMPAITPEIRAMAVSDQYLNRDVVTYDYIQRVAKQDNDLASKLAKKYLDGYMVDANNGLVPPLPNDRVEELSKLSGRDLSAKSAFDAMGGAVGGLFHLIDSATRAPTKVGAYATLEQGFRYQDKNVNPNEIKPGDLDQINVANVDLDKLPPYYAGQLKAGFSQNIAKQVDTALRESHPDWLGTTMQPDPDPEKDKLYQGIVDKVFQQRQDWDYYSDFATPADGVNALFSTPGLRMADARGEDYAAHEQNILGTGNIAGITTFARVTQFVKDIKDAGVVIDPEDRASMRSGWSAETVNKYAKRLAEKGVSLSDIVLQQGMTWPELKRALDLAQFPGENQADIARSLGFKVENEKDTPIFTTVGYNPSQGYGLGGQVSKQTGTEHEFTVSNPDLVVSLDDLRTKSDAGWISGEQLASLIGNKYTYAYLADVKTVPFQDLMAAIAFDPTNYGKLQLIWEPVGLLFKGGAKVAKLGGKALTYGVAGLGDVGVGALKTVGNLIGKFRGVETKLLKPEDWNKVSNAAHYLMSETAQSVTNKITNRAFFVTKTLIAPEYLADGEGTLRWVDQVLPKMQEAARTGEWTEFIKQVPAGAGDYAASGLNAISGDLRRIAADEDAFGRFADSVVKPFGDEIGEADIKELRQLTERGDYAGLTRWLADKHVSQRIMNGMEVDEARKSLDASDLINHTTASYRSGVQVLTDKSLGTFGKELVSPAAARINDTLSMVARHWTNAVLTARPGWNVINWLDNNARLIANGFNPSADVRDLERQLADLGVTSTQMREIIYGGNFMDEAVRLSVPVTPEVRNAAKFAGRVTVNSDPKEVANLVELATRASDSLRDLPAEARKVMEDRVNRLRVEADKLAKGKGDIKAVRSAAARVDDLSNQMFGKSATVDTNLFKSHLDQLREYGNILKSGDGNAIARIWNNWVEMGHAVHRDIEASARMKVFAPTYIDKYHEALGKLSRDLPQFPDETQLAARFAHVTDLKQQAELINEAKDAYTKLGQRLNGLVNEAAMKPSKLPDVQSYLEELRTSPRSAARNFIYSTQPVVEGMTPAADTLMQKVGDWASDVADGMSMEDLRNPERMRQLVDDINTRINTRLRVEGAEANLMARINEITKPSTHVPDSVVNWAKDGQITNPRDIAVTVKRMQKISRDIEDVNREFGDSFLDLNHTPYLDALDRTQRQLPERAHRYDLMRDSFADKFNGEATWRSSGVDQPVEIVGAYGNDKSGRIFLKTAGGTGVPLDEVALNDPQRQWYLEQYAKWEATKPAGNSLLTRSGIGDVTGSGARMRKPAYAATGEAGKIPPDVARSYTHRLEDDIVARGGQIPTEYVDADGVKHALAYDSADDFVQRFGTPGSGLGFYKPRGGGDSLIAGVQRTADNWTYLAKLADANDMDDLADVYVNGRRVSEIYAADADITKIKQDIFGNKSSKVQVKYKRDGVDYILTNDPKRGETLTDVTRRLWRDNLEGVYIETRGQWVPVFDPNAAAGSRITFQKLGRDETVDSLRVPVQVGSSIPDEVGEQLLKIQEAAEPVEQIGIQVEGALARLDNLLRAAPEPPPFKPDFTLGGVDVEAGKMRRLPEGGYGVEIRYADGRTQVAKVSELQPKPVEGALNANVAGTPEQLAAEAGKKTAEQQATIEALDPAAEFMKRHPVIQSREDLLGRGELLRQQGVPVTDQQLNDMADILEAVSQNRFKQEPDFLLKRLNLTSVPPAEGLYQQADEALKKDIRAGWMTDEERLAVYNEAIAHARKFNSEPNAVVEEARKYLASQGKVGAHGEPLFQATSEGEALGAYKSVFGPNGLTGMIHLGPGATTETIGHEVNHFIMAMMELPDQVFKGPEFDVLRKELRADFDVIAEAAGAPMLKYAGERGKKATRPVMYENLWRVDRKASKLEDEAAFAKFSEEARAASERSARMWTTYLETGQAPTKKLQGVFDRFKSWLAGIFQVKQQHGEQVPIEVKRIFDKWLAENPEWKLTRKGSYVMSSNKDAMESAMKISGQLDDWSKAVDNLRVAYGDGFSDSGAVEAMHAKAKELINSYKRYAKKSGAGAAAVEETEDFLDTEAGDALVVSFNRLEKDGDTLREMEGNAKPTITQLIEKDKVEQRISDHIQTARKYGVEIPDEASPSDAMKLIDEYINARQKQLVSTESTTELDEVKRLVEEFWQAYGDMLQDGKFHPKQYVNGKWVYPENAGPMMVEGKLRAGQVKPPRADQAGYLEQSNPTIDDILSKEKGTPATLDELAALNAPGSTYVSPALLEVMKYHAGVKDYLNQWRESMLRAIDGGFLPGTSLPGIDPADMENVQQWLGNVYAGLGRASSQAQKLAEDKTRLVMMDFETTYNLDRLMQQGPALPQWTGKLAGARPLRVGGIVPFFKFPRENIESWINTLGNHPALIHNVARYQEEANVERKRFNLPGQFLPTWPVKVGDKVVSVSPFAFISLGQMIRPFSPYIDEDANGVDQALGVAGQMGFSLGPTLRLALNALGLSEEAQPIIPQAQSLIPPGAYKNISEPLQWALGLKSKRDEFYVNRQIVYDALADMSNVQSESAKQDILKDMYNAISSPTSPRRVAASDHYYTMKFDTANTGYLTGIYPREVSQGELDLRQYKTDVAQLRSAMVSAGLSPDQVDRIEGYMAGDPRADANRRLNDLYNADPAKAISNTETEAWANSVETAGKRNEYYSKRAMVEAEFQQKYGFSGTALTDADREEYSKQIDALNQQYADVLTSKTTTREAWMSDEDYQRGLASSWLETLSGTRPQFTQYKTYAEYERAVDKWEKDLPEISKQLWQTIQVPLGEASTRNISEIPGYLSAVSNKTAMDQFRSKYDTVNDAIYNTLRDKYYNGYWDAVNGKVGPERLLAEMEYKQKHPVPGETEIQTWLAEGLYAKRFSGQSISRELKAHPVADIENSILSGKTLPERQAYELSNLLSRIPPGNAYFDFVDTLPKDIQKHLQTFQDDSYSALESPTKWLATYTALKDAINAQFKQPSLNDVREWVNAVHENEQMQGQRDMRFPGIKSSLDAYNAIDRGDAVARKQYRSQHPEIGKYYDWLYNEWQTSHPLWQKYYGSAESTPTKTASGYSRTTSYGGYGGKRYRAGGGGGRRSYSSGSSGTYGAGSGVSQALQDQWNGFRDMAGTALYNALTSHWDNGAALSGTENSLLQSLYQQYSFGAKDFNDWLENVLPKLRSAMIPGESIFSKNKRYDNQQNQPQTSFGYSSWFSRLKNAA